MLSHLPANFLVDYVDKDRAGIPLAGRTSLPIPHSTPKFKDPKVFALGAARRADR
jgi:hypothetical protein